MTLETKRSDLSITRVVPDEAFHLLPGQCRLRIDQFALTTNNITYGIFGDMLRYWDVFPTTDSESEWGRIPTWGFAEVVETLCDEVSVGERFFGFLPMSSETVITPGKIDARGLSDISPHRQALAGAYNHYQRASTDPIYDKGREAQQMVLYPLFFTSFVIDDFLSDNEDFGAAQAVISSASSKTAIGFAHLAKLRGLETVGLTSRSNLAFVESLEIYTEVVTYEDIASLAPCPAVYVDIAGNQDLLRQIHSHFAGELNHSMVVGNTNWNHQPTDSSALLPPQPAFLFAPAQIAKRTKEWGRDTLDQRIGTAWKSYSNWTDTWITFPYAVGSAEVLATYNTLQSGQPDPKLGYICSLPKEEAK